MKKTISILIISICSYHAGFTQSSAQNGLKLWYDRPASIWEEALPLGNGKTGAMVFGGVSTERYQLNDNTLWSGFPDPGNNPDAPKLLPLVRELIFAGNYDSAASVWKKMQGPYSARYLPLADLWISKTGSDTITDFFYRDLDLQNAIATVKFKTNGISYTRETFISFPSKAMVIRITADRPQSVDIDIALTSKLRYSSSTLSGNYLVLTGKAPRYVANREQDPQQVVYDESPDGEGMNFQVHVSVKLQDGNSFADNQKLKIRKASSVTIYLTEATSFNGFDKSPGLAGRDPSVEASRLMKAVQLKSFEQLKNEHVKDYQRLFNRVTLDLGKNPQLLQLPTDMRLRNYFTNQDNQLVTLYYQFGRYLMIAGSRPGSRPTNLQGIWNDHVQPPWGSNYTTNINTEMNYWPAENTNLSECHQPLFDFMKELSVNGSKTAKTNYNINKGWVVHHNSDLWAKTSPPGGWDKDPRAQPRWSAWPMAGAWFSTHMWEHYLFTGDKKFLKDEAYPLMKGAAEFLLQWLVPHPELPYLVTNPSTSPENTIKIKGKEYQLSLASTMDMSICRELFTSLIKASEILNFDPAFRNQLKDANSKLYPYQIGQFGQLQEWFADWDDPNDKHRHLSHLFGLFPGSQITLNHSPELAAAAKQSLIHRGDVSTGWSMAWKINWWARLRDAEHAFKILNSAFTYINPREKRETMGGGGTYPNLFDAHPPFQIDGNFGATAGITEMLLQSHEGEIALLPALPAAWANGSVKGIKARGNFEIQMDWSKGELVKAKIFSVIGGTCRLRTSQPVTVVETKAVLPKDESINPLYSAFGTVSYKKNTNQKLQDVPNASGKYLIEFKTEKGKTYTIIPVGKKTL